MTIEIRATQPDEYRAAADAMTISLLHAPPSDEVWERGAESWDHMPSFSAWDGDRCVGHAGHFLVDTTVPGGARLPTGAVSRVGVLPTHRRRGAATGLMRALVDDACERQLPLMSLRASEATIYSRYGFGVAGDFVAVEIDPARASPLAGAATGGSFRILPGDEILDVVPALYDRIAHRRPGIITRPHLFWWKRYLREAIDRSKASFVAVHSDDDGNDDGFAHYDVEWTEESNPGSVGRGEAMDVFGATDAAELALWQFLFDLDLVTVWRATERPIDDIVRVAASDRRGYRVTGFEDEQWLRLVDVDAALTSRTYNPCSDAVVIEVVDPMISPNRGTWLIDAEGARRGGEDPQLVVDIATLSSVYLGGTSWAAVAATGAVDERRAGSVATADHLFASRPLPFCGSFF
jgi:predicted acetyltransferase